MILDVITMLTNTNLSLIYLCIYFFEILELGTIF